MTKKILRRFSNRNPAQSRDFLPDWGALIGSDRGFWEDARARALAGPRVLIATAVGGNPQMTVLESALAVALTLRGARVDVLLCDAELTACLRAKITGISPSDLAKGNLKKFFCGPCVEKGRAVFDGLGLDLLSFRANIPGDPQPGSERDDVILQEHALAGALRYYGRGDLENEPDGPEVVERYRQSAELARRSVKDHLERKKYDVVLMNHGIYVPHGILTALCKQKGVRSVAWNLGYRRQTAIFSHGDTYHHTLMAEPTKEWEGMMWSKAHETAIMDYLLSRQNGSARDWIWFNNNPDEDLERFARETGLNWKKPVIGLLTNVIWDAQLHYPANAFKNMTEWVLQTVDYFSKRPDLQLLIRVHPGELAPPGGVTKSRQPVIREILKVFPSLPRNVFIIPPESPVSTYSAMRRCGTVLIYGTKTGVELTSMGIPVVVAGEAWIRNKGLTRDADSREEYFRILSALPESKKMASAAVDRARRYAYHFFFRRMVPLPFLRPASGWPPYRIALESIRDLNPGRYPGLDIVCDGILHGSPFIFPAERFGVHDAPAGVP